MKLAAEVRRRIAETPASGGSMIEQIPVRKDAVLVYGVLATLVAEGNAKSAGKGPGEQLWGVPGAARRAPRPARAPESFRMDDETLASIESAIHRLTEGLPAHFFEELRRVAVARADQLAYDGAKVPNAARQALSELGPPTAARRYLQQVVAGRNPRQRLTTRRPRRALIVLAVMIALVGMLRWFVIGWYHLPEGQISMAPTLVPGVEGGDELVLANLLAYRMHDPVRGDLVVFDAPGGHVPYVKRVMGLPGESVAIRDGDVWIDGKRLVKEREFLDRVAVRMSDFVRTDQGWQQRHAAHTGFPLPDGSMEQRRARAGDLILEGTFTLKTFDDVATIFIMTGDTVRHHVVFDAKGYGGGVFAGNKTLARGTPCQLELNRSYRVWVTNADRVLRVELDGVEIARGVIQAPTDGVRIEIRLENGAIAEDLSVSRDLVYTTWPGAPDRWRLGQSYFMLGDNSPVSRDSRSLGAISRSALHGRVWCVAWPISRARTLR